MIIFAFASEIGAQAKLKKNMETAIYVPNDHEALRDKDHAELRPFSLYNSTESRRGELHAIVAAARGGAIGRGGEIPWHISEDLKHFKALTQGHPVIMGRATWESLPKRPLPGRRNIVVTRQRDYEAPGAEIAGSPEEAIGMCSPDEQAFIIGGGGIYRATLPYCTTLHLTRVELDVEDADTWFPLPDDEDWTLSEAGQPQATAEGVGYKFETWRRKK